MDNKNILNEAFFKKTTYAERMAKKLPQYSPISVKDAKTSNPLQNSNAFQVTDTDEIKKRLSQTYGVVFGNNNVKGMASRALKTFPIIISDAVEPETAMMLKKLMEEQYAEYVNLLISNQVVNLADYSTTAEDGNIAMQALDKISGVDFSSNRLPNKALRGSTIGVDDVFENVPLYNLMRESQRPVNTGDPIVDALLENAVILPVDEAEQFLEFVENNSDEIVSLLETKVIEPEEGGKPKYSEGGFKVRYKYDNDRRATADQTHRIKNFDKNVDADRGFAGVDGDGKEIYLKLSTADIVLDKKRFEYAINRTVGETLTAPENAYIRDRFEKASFLLQCRRISGMEYANYLTIRLGIPVSEGARRELLEEFPVSKVLSGRGVRKVHGKYELDTLSAGEVTAIHGNFIYDAEAEAELAHNAKLIKRPLSLILRPKIKTVLQFVGSVGAGALAGGVASTVWNGYNKGTLSSGWSGFVETLKNMVTVNPLGIGMSVILGGAIGVGAFALWKLWKKKKQEFEAKEKELHNKLRIEGWERVEFLINEMDRQRAEIRSGKFSNNYQRSATSTDINNNAAAADKLIGDANKSMLQYQKDLGKFTGTVPTKGMVNDNPRAGDLNKDFENAKKNYEKQLSESLDIEPKSTFTTAKNILESAEKFDLDGELGAILEEIMTSDKEFKADYLVEKVLATTSVPMVTRYIENKPNKDVLITPSFGVRDAYAYGSTEIERKENKDRKYNQPLIMTVKFKERFSDGKYPDNELVAVIGILGKLIRVSSDEMEYILKRNSEGSTLEGFLKTGNLGDTIADMLSGTKISQDIKNLPQSADVWHNLEKVATLAAANKISGKRNGNVANAHIVFSQKEIDDVRTETGVDYIRDVKKAVSLMKRYSAFTVMVANDIGQRVSILDDQDSISWSVVPYSAIAGKDTGDQLASALSRLQRDRL